MNSKKYFIETVLLIDSIDESKWEKLDISFSTKEDAVDYIFNKNDGIYYKLLDTSIRVVCETIMEELITEKEFLHRSIVENVYGRVSRDCRN